MFTSMFRSDKADIYVFFSTGNPDLHNREIPRFVPGETVSGYIEITPAENIKYKKILTRVKWRTEGRGDPDTSDWMEIVEPEGALHAGIVKTIPFSCPLPPEPWSYAGHYITIVWGVEVEIDVAWQTNPRHFAPFILAPDWASENNQGDAPPRVKPSER